MSIWVFGALLFVASNAVAGLFVGRAGGVADFVAVMAGGCKSGSCWGLGSRLVFRLLSKISVGVFVVDLAVRGVSGVEIYSGWKVGALTLMVSLKGRGAGGF